MVLLFTSASVPLENMADFFRTQFIVSCFVLFFRSTGDVMKCFAIMGIECSMTSSIVYLYTVVEVVLPRLETTKE